MILIQFFKQPALWLTAVFLLLMSSCNTRYLQEGETLYVGNKVKIEDSVLRKNQVKNLQEELSDIIRPKANRSFLGLRFKLWVYHLAGEPEEEVGLRYWLRNKVGEPPVLGSDMNISANETLIDNYLQNRGYFSVASEGEKVTKHKRTRALFTVRPGIRDSIRSVRFDVDEHSVLGRDILESSKETVLQTKQPYNLNVIMTERERIARYLKDKGYFFFNPEYLIVEADTGAASHKMDLSVQIKEDMIPSNASYRYQMRNIYIYPNYRNSGVQKTKRTVAAKDSTQRQTRNRSSWMKEDTTYYKGYGLIGRGRTYKPKVFYQAMQLESGEYYNFRDQNIALNRLVNLGAFKFVKNEFIPVRNRGGEEPHLLDLIYYLSPYPHKQLSANIGAHTQNDNRVGSRMTISWKNNNAFRGAEILSFKASGGFDIQYGGEVKVPNLYNLNLEAGLNFPRFIVPFVSIKPSKLFIPRTLLKVGYDYSLGKDYYQISSFSMGWGYNWKESASKEHRLFPINVAFVKTDTLDINQANRLNLSRLTFNGLIIGPTYEYTYNSQLEGKKRRDNYYFNGRADFSGNVLGWIMGSSLDQPAERIFKRPFAQYAKIEADFRYYHQYTREKSMAYRIYAGFGLPYGNSRNLPNIKQFYSGGSSSLRGFASRLVGPGSYNYNAQTNNAIFIEMLGDMKLEANLDYRFPIYQFIKGGLFADAGNVWLYRPNNDLPGGAISRNFYKEIALDAGVGLRFDFSILILRLDLGMPLRKPWLPAGNRWVFEDINPLSPSWRKSNLFLNVAIGYPF